MGITNNPNKNPVIVEFVVAVVMKDGCVEVIVDALTLIPLVNNAFLFIFSKPINLVVVLGTEIQLIAVFGGFSVEFVLTDK